MLKPINNGKLFVSVSFRQEIISISKRKVLQIDPEIVETLKFLSFSMQFLYEFQVIPL